jgi:hypothetical protein
MTRLPARREQASVCAGRRSFIPRPCRAGLPKGRGRRVRGLEDARSETRAKHVLVAMDCCYGGRLVVPRSSTASRFARKLLTEKAHVVISSGRPNELVSDGAAGEHSPFAAAFLEALERPGEITSSMLLGFLHERYRAAGSTRLPQLGYPEGHPLGGEFVFFGE